MAAPTNATSSPSSLHTPGSSLPATLESGGQHHKHDHEGISKIGLVRIALVGAAVVFCWLRVWQPYPRLDLIGLLAFLAGGYPIYREAFANLLSRRMTMELSMTIALAATLVIGEVFTALVIVFFVLIAEVLEELTVDRGRSAIRELLDFLPQRAELQRGDSWEVVPVSTLAPGDVVIIRPGARIPVDGEVTSGHSFVDQSTITGESLPIEMAPGGVGFCWDDEPERRAGSAHGDGGKGYGVRKDHRSR